MPSILNSDDGAVSGTSGLKSTGGNDGLLNIQSNGSTVVAVTGSGIAVTGTMSQTGVSTFAAGTAGAPSITFTGDTNTGIFSPAADTIAFSEGGAEAMRIDSSGNVGIGATSPDVFSFGSTYKIFTVQNTATNGNVVQFIVPNGTGDANIQFGNPTYRRASINADSSSNLTFATNTTNSSATGVTNHMRITSAGNVGIGTTEPKLNSNAGTFLSVVGTNANGWLDLGTTSSTDGLGGTLTFNNTNIVGSDKRTAYIGSERAGANNTANLIFATNNAGTLAERARIPAAGGFQCVNSISVGNATPTTSGAGITFPATQSASSNANTLDDYEEGTWTPTVSGWTSVTYDHRVGKYTKIGNQVTAWFYIQFSGTSAATIVDITGLPFSEFNSLTRGGALSYYNVTINETTGVLAYVNETTINFYTDNDSGSIILSNGNVTNQYLIGSVTYQS